MRHCGNTGLHNGGPRTKMAAIAVNYYPTKPSAFSTFQKLAAATKSKSKHDIMSWLLKQDSYTLHRPVRKRFPRNPYTITNVMYIWEYDVMDMQSLSKYKDKYKYLLSGIDVSKYLYIVPLRSKTGTAENSAFRSMQIIRDLYAATDLGAHR